MKNKFYFLLGEWAVKVYNEEGIDVLINSHNMGNAGDCALYLYDENVNTPYDLVANTQGWFDFAELTEEEYSRILKAM